MREIGVAVLVITFLTIMSPEIVAEQARKFVCTFQQNCEGESQ